MAALSYFASAASPATSSGLGAGKASASSGIWSGSSNATVPVAGSIVTLGFVTINTTISLISAKARSNV